MAAPEADCKGVVHAEGPQERGGQGDEGGGPPDERYDQGSHQDEQVVGPVVVGVAFEPGFQLFLRAWC